VARLVLPEVPYGELARPARGARKLAGGIQGAREVRVRGVRLEHPADHAVAAVMTGPARPAQADTRAASKY